MLDYKVKIGGEITILSMGPLTVKDFLLRLTRLGAFFKEQRINDKEKIRCRLRRRI